MVGFRGFDDDFIRVWGLCFGENLKSFHRFNAGITPKPYTLNPKPQNPKTPNPKPSTLDPKTAVIEHLQSQSSRKQPADAKHAVLHGLEHCTDDGALLCTAETSEARV